MCITFIKVYYGKIDFVLLCTTHSPWQPVELNFTYHGGKKKKRNNPHFPDNKLKFRKVKQLAQDHTACLQQHQDSNPGSLVPEPALLKREIWRENGPLVDMDFMIPHKNTS